MPARLVWHRTIRLYVGGAAYRLEAWLNGQYIGTHEGAYTAFCLDATASRTPPVKQQIVIRVTSLSRTSKSTAWSSRTCPFRSNPGTYAEGGFWGEFGSRPFRDYGRIDRGRTGLTPEMATSRDYEVERRFRSRYRLDLLVTVDPDSATRRLPSGWRDPVAVPPGRANAFSADIRLRPTYAVVVEHPRSVSRSRRACRGRRVNRLTYTTSGCVTSRLFSYMAHYRFSTANRSKFVALCCSRISRLV